MTAWDAGTVAATAALIVACLASLIALAQVLQQYFLTGQLIRLCDSVVFGPLPGQGHRIWQPSQFRFRVVYSIPQFSLDAYLWPDQSPHVKSYAIGRHKLPFLDKPDGLQDDEFGGSAPPFSISSSLSRPSWFRFPLKRSRPRLPQPDLSHRGVGEASWVSFWRVIRRPCGDSLRFDHVEYDADRCPPDLVTAPMQVSMRDVIVMGLMAGMQVTSCSFSHKSVSMQGEVGTITSASHPVLGPILHFTPRDLGELPADRSTLNDNTNGGIVETRWLLRACDICIVARTFFASRERRTTRRLDERWIKDHKRISTFELSVTGGRNRRHRDEPNREEDHPNAEPEGNPLKASDYRKSDIHADDDDTSMIGKGKAIESNVIRARTQDGPWAITMLPATSLHSNNEVKGETDDIIPEGKDSRTPAEASERPSDIKTADAADRSRGGYHATVEDYSNADINSIDGPERGPSSLHKSSSDDWDRIRTARIRQGARRLRLVEVQRDKFLVEEAVKRGTMPSTYQPRRLLLTSNEHNAEQEQSSEHNAEQEQSSEPTTEEKAARQREQERQKLRWKREDEREDRNRARDTVIHLASVDMFWLCQIDIFRGYSATPWHDPRSMMPLQSVLVGAVTIILEALLGFLDDRSLIYTDSHYGTHESFQGTASWLSEGNCTYPAYALNGRGGVIAGHVSWLGVRIPAFKTSVIPALELLHSYEWQVDPCIRDQIRWSEKQSVELMRLDSWLSYLGRTSEIADGPNKLLKQTPALISLLSTEFELDFQNIDVSASEGGLQDIQGLCANVMDFLTDEELTEAEQLYVLVALLRAAKVGQSLRAGVDTHYLREILLNDIQVHLV